MSATGSEIRLDVNGKSVNAYFASPSEGGPGVLVLPSWWGLKPFFKQLCDRLAEQGYAALAPDYYGGRVAQTVEEAETIQKEAEGDQEAMAALIKAAKDYVASLRPGRPMAILGLSMGTDWAIVTAAKDAGVAAIVLYYGCYGVDFSEMKARVLGHFAEKDEWQPLDYVRKVEQQMKDAGVEVTFHVYPGAAHWFMEEDRPEYDAAAAALAWERTVRFLRDNMG